MIERKRACIELINCGLLAKALTQCSCNGINPGALSTVQMGIIDFFRCPVPAIVATEHFHSNV
jgi:hypothetical protein